MSNSGTKKLFVETHGCQMNEYDSARMADLLGASHGLEQTDSADEADVLLLNTCSIREKAQEKVFHQIGRWKKIKDKTMEQEESRKTRPSSFALTIRAFLNPRSAKYCACPPKKTKTKREQPRRPSVG